MDEDVVTPTESEKINKLVQLLAVLVERLGGEVVIDEMEFEVFEDAEVLVRNLTSGYILLKVVDDELSTCPACEE